MFVCLGFGHLILFVYFFPWPRSSKGPRMGRQFFKNVVFKVKFSSVFQVMVVWKTCKSK